MYRVILTKNGEYKKTLHRCKKRETSFVNFHKIKRENGVIFERKHINYKGIIPVSYKIYVVKDHEEGDEVRMVRDKLGRLVEEQPIFGIWTVLADAPYSIEESFWVYGYDPVHERKDFMEIISLLLEGMTHESITKQIIVVKNKLVVYNEDTFEMVVCKCQDDAQRLHHSLAKAFNEVEVKNLYFMGTATDPKIIGDYYEIIHENTGWNYTKIWRTTTRP